MNLFLQEGISQLQRRNCLFPQSFVDSWRLQKDYPVVEYFSFIVIVSMATFLVF